MPNFWTKTTQKIAEAFSGPRTKDNEFDLKMEEMKRVEKGISGFKHLLNNFLHYTISIKNMSKEFASSIKGVYEKESPFSLIANDLIDAHIDMEKFYDDFHNNVQKLVSKTSEWNSLFSQAKVELNKRESSRKTYDHYDGKLEKIYKERAERIRKNLQMESSKEIEFVERNERKYKKASEDFMKASEVTFTTVQTILDRRYSLINPVISQFVEDERLFFSSISNLFKKFESIGTKFRGISSSLEKTIITYDPTKHIRGKELCKDSNKSPREKSNHIGIQENEEEDKRYRSKSNIPIKNNNDQNERKTNHNHIRNPTEDFYFDNNNNNKNVNMTKYLDHSPKRKNNQTTHSQSGNSGNSSNNLSPNKVYNLPQNQTNQNFLDVDYEGFNNISNNFNNQHRYNENQDSRKVSHTVYNPNLMQSTNNNAFKNSNYSSNNSFTNSNSSNYDNQINQNSQFPNTGPTQNLGNFEQNNYGSNYYVNVPASAGSNYPRFSELDVEGIQNMQISKGLQGLDMDNMKQNFNDGMKVANQVNSYTKTANQFLVNNNINFNNNCNVSGSFTQKNQSANNVNAFLNHTSNKNDKNFEFDNIFNNKQNSALKYTNTSNNNNNPHKNLNNDIFKDLF
jgi:hypothetical protein